MENIEIKGTSMWKKRKRQRETKFETEAIQRIIDKKNYKKKFNKTHIHDYKEKTKE